MTEWFTTRRLPASSTAAPPFSHAIAASPLSTSLSRRLKGMVTKASEIRQEMPLSLAKPTELSLQLKRLSHVCNAIFFRFKPAVSARRFQNGAIYFRNCCVYFALHCSTIYSDRAECLSKSVPSYSRPTWYCQSKLRLRILNLLRNIILQLHA